MGGTIGKYRLPRFFCIIRQTLNGVAEHEKLDKMKKIFSLIGVMTILIVAMCSLSSFSTPASSDSKEKSCTVKITTKDGYAAKYITVSLETGGFLEGGFKDFRTDENGYVVLTWVSKYTKYLYIKGDKYPVEYEDGGNYSLTLKKKYSEI